MAPTLENATLRCATCKHRGNDPLEAYRYDEDTLEDLPVTYYECKRVGHGNKESGKKAYMPGQKALAVDGSGYYAKLAVENDFGCVLWEQKA